MTKDNKEKLCLFYASDYHFEMISLPFISKELKDDKNVVVMTENSLNETVDELLSKINLNNNDRDKLKGINWSAGDFSKLDEVKCANEKGKKSVVFVKGKENYISDVNKSMEGLVSSGNVKVIDCYDINEVHKDVGNIVKNYGQVLFTSGIEKLL